MYLQPFRKCKEKRSNKDRDLAFANIQRMDRDTMRNVKKENHNMYRRKLNYPMASVSQLTSRVRVCVCVCVCARARACVQCAHLLCLTLCGPVDCSLPGSSVQGIFRQEYWSGVPLPALGADTEIEPVFPMSPSQAGGSLPAKPIGKPQLATPWGFPSFWGRVSLPLREEREQRAINFELRGVWGLNLCPKL